MSRLTEEIAAEIKAPYVRTRPRLRRVLRQALARIERAEVDEGKRGAAVRKARRLITREVGR